MIGFRPYLWLFLCFVFGFSSCKRKPLPEGETWKGVFDLSSKKGRQPAQAILNLNSQEGRLFLPDLIPVPLDLKEMRVKGDSIFFTIGFRSGDAHCEAKLFTDSLYGTMSFDGMPPSPFWLVKTALPGLEKGQPKPDGDVPITVTTKSETASEKHVKRRLEKLFDSFDLEKYLYTKGIQIQDSIIPHSHPVLTLNTAFRDDVHLLSTFLHEQMHWYTLSKHKEVGQVAHTIIKTYTNVPVNLPEGGGSEQSTYLHILVNYLEFHALSQVIGYEKAKSHMEFMCTQHYTWVYKTILEDEKELETLLSTNKLLFE